MKIVDIQGATRSQQMLFGAALFELFVRLSQDTERFHNRFRSRFRADMMVNERFCGKLPGGSDDNSKKLNPDLRRKGRRDSIPQTTQAFINDDQTERRNEVGIE